MMLSIRFNPTTILCSLLVAGMLFVAFTPSSSAQERIQTLVASGPTTIEVIVERGTVAYVSGNDVVIKGQDGTLRLYPDVPDDFTVTVDGEELTVHEIRPGMTIKRTTIRSTTPRVITTVKSVKGTIWQISPPSSAILTLENGENQQFKIPPGTKFTVDGEQVDAFALKPGMKVSATAVTEVPETTFSQEVLRTGHMPPPPIETIDTMLALLIIVEQTPLQKNVGPDDSPVSEAIAALEPEADNAVVADVLPTTASSLPLTGLLGGVLCCCALGLRLRRVV